MKQDPPILDYARPTPRRGPLGPMDDNARGLWLAYTMACIGGAMIAAMVDSAIPKLMGPRSWEDGFEIVVIFQILFIPLLLVIRLCVGVERVNWRVGAVTGLSPLLILLYRIVFR